MADEKNKIDIHLRAKGGKAAAREIEEVADEISGLEGAADDLVREALERTEQKFQDITDGLDEVEESFDHGTDAVEKTGESMEKTGKKAGGLMGWLKGLGGSMLAAFSAASLLDRGIGLLANSIAKALAKQDEMLRSAAQAGPEIVRTHLKTADALRELPTAAEAAVTALDDYYAVIDRHSAAAENQAADAQALANAHRMEAESLIALREAQGEIDGEEAREERRKLAIEARIEQHERELAHLQEIEAGEIRKAEAAERVLAAAKAAAEASREDVDTFAGAGGDRARGDIVDPELRKSVTSLGKEAAAAKRRLEQLDTFGGRNEARGEVVERLQADASLYQRLNPISAAATLITAQLEVSDLIAQAEEEAALLADTYAKQKDKLKAQIDEEAANREERFKRDQAAAEQAKDEAAKQRARAGTAGDEVTRKTAVGGEILDRTNEADQILADAEAARRNRAEADRLAKDLAGRLANKVARAREGSGNEELVSTLGNISELLSDATTEAELATVQGMLTSAVAGAVNLNESTRKELDAVKQQLRTIQSQIQQSTAR